MVGASHVVVEASLEALQAVVVVFPEGVSAVRRSTREHPTARYRVVHRAAPVRHSAVHRQGLPQDRASASREPVDHRPILPVRPDPVSAAGPLARIGHQRLELAPLYRRGFVPGPDSLGAQPLDRQRHRQELVQLDQVPERCRGRRCQDLAAADRESVTEPSVGGRETCGRVLAKRRPAVI